eukprot:CAMPEP_0179354126 /NCGR_PEP_ID=MMETSP0797-20121207/76687_1 /TAXON_ID=47934 /ORGANISM="Dinophysis acuminata, Strain DAEP01" /LENGTH=115 /DNA_ID=CAMNT_0021069213 /DNA_START=80 /DNA_END=425 /DNA_ORIENTATION=+
MISHVHASHTWSPAVTRTGTGTTIAANTGRKTSFAAAGAVSREEHGPGAAAGALLCSFAPLCGPVLLAHVEALAARRREVLQRPRPEAAAAEQPVIVRAEVEDEEGVEPRGLILK